MKIVTINENDSGQRVDKFLSKYLPNMPKSLLYKQLRKKRIKRNKKALAAQDILCAGDELYLYINDEFFEEKEAPKGDFSGLSVIYEDENVLIANKPAGVSSHGGEDSILAQIQSYLYHTGAYNPKDEHSFTPALSNRLDKNTAGLILATKNAAAQRELNEKIKAGEVTKQYLCLAHGTFKEKEGQLENWLYISPDENRVFVASKEKEGAKEAKLIYRVLEQQKDRALLEVTLLSGRKHQIRVQLAHAGHPLVGDRKYGAPKDEKFAYQALCAYRITFNFTSETKVLTALAGKIFTIQNPWK
ncbi:MAG: RluA family pseudouridine synthase [Clostridia bacterium]|nr:RluA family pseudouridine synthase [Clostridia bacterium]